MFRASKNPEISIREKQHNNRVRKLAPEGVVLLKNEFVLPLKELKDIALYGTGVRYSVKGGAGSGDVNTRDMVNIEQGFINAGINIVNSEWLDRYDDKYQKGYTDYVNTAKKKLEDGVGIVEILLNGGFINPEHDIISEEDCRKYSSETAIYVVSRNSGEGTDRKNERGDYMLSRIELASIKILAQTYMNLIVVLNIGGAIEMKELSEIEGIASIVLISQPGNQIGDILADVITGKSFPSGKLTTTWTKEYSDYPYGNEYSHNDNEYNESYYREGIFVGYRYFETYKVKPMYCFGYGLSYAKLSNKTLETSMDGTRINLKVEVANDSRKYPGKEVIQVYVSKPGTHLCQPDKVLAGFRKTEEINPGESQIVDITVDMIDLVSYDEANAQWILEDGKYIFFQGNSVENCSQVAVVNIPELIVLKKVKNVMPKIYEFSELRREHENINIDEDLPVYTIRKELFQTEVVEYGTAKFETPATIPMDKITLDDIVAGKATVEEMISQLTAEEMTYLTIGNGWENAKSGDSIVGAASLSVPGAAGETTSKLMDSRKIPGLVMADGPAGLRLLQEFGIDEEGKLIGNGVAMPLMDELCENEETVEPAEKYYQYCTAMPIATMLAQTFNMDLLEQLGDIVGTEMEEFGVNMWLAPGMNIHKNVLCGRNFEYYSEDPYLSGMCASAITKGVQKHKGCTTTVKHFALNNQEVNRQFNNSNVGERAMREIYLKGFEICINEANPGAVMTSYNLINGEHTATNSELLKTVLREEWKYDGLVMSDWGTTVNERLGVNTGEPKYSASYPSECIVASNDIIMPGLYYDMQIIKDAAAKGDESGMTMDDLRFCAANVVKTILRLI